MAARGVDGKPLTGWWVMHSQDLGEALHRVAQGEDPGLVYIELYANAEVEVVPPNTPV